MHPAEFEPSIPVIERSQITPFDRTVTGNDVFVFDLKKKWGGLK